MQFGKSAWSKTRNYSLWRMSAIVTLYSSGRITHFPANIFQMQSWTHTRRECHSYGLSNVNERARKNPERIPLEIR